MPSFISKFAELFCMSQLTTSTSSWSRYRRLSFTCHIVVLLTFDSAYIHIFPTFHIFFLFWTISKAFATSYHLFNVKSASFFVSISFNASRLLSSNTNWSLMRSSSLWPNWQSSAELFSFLTNAHILSLPCSILLSVSIVYWLISRLIGKHLTVSMLRQL